MTQTAMKSARYSRQGLWTLFLMCAFPLHVWTLLLGFRDASWVTERTSAWDAVGVVSYGLVFAFIESSVVFLLIALLGFLVSTEWDELHRIALLSLLVLLAACWATYAQAYFLWNLSPPGGLVWLVSRFGHPLRVLYVCATGAVLVTILPAALLVLRNARFFSFVRAMIDRLALLTGFYLILDILGLMIVIMRNV
jgi:hypothetical protein